MSLSNAVRIGSRFVWKGRSASGSSTSLGKRDRKRMNMTVHASMMSFRVIPMEVSDEPSLLLLSRDATRTLRGETMSVSCRKGSFSGSGVVCRGRRSVGIIMSAMLSLELCGVVVVVEVIAAGGSNVPNDGRLRIERDGLDRDEGTRRSCPEGV